MDISAAIQRHKGSGSGEGGDVRPPPLEYRRSVHLHLEDTGAMSGGGDTAGGAGVNEMVITGLTGTRSGRVGGGDKDGVGGGGGDDV